jgi:hypothetical protein
METEPAWAQARARVPVRALEPEPAPVLARVPEPVREPARV